jgi:hypothetical protein
VIDVDPTNCPRHQLAYNQPLRVTVQAIAGWMSGMTLYKKRFRRRLPDARRREQIVYFLVASRFGDLVDRPAAIHRSRAACDRDQSAPSVSLESVNTTLILGAEVFESEPGDWERCYQLWSKRLRGQFGVKESFRQPF